MALTKKRKRPKATGTKKRTRPKVASPNVGKSYTATAATSKARPTGGSKFAGRSWGLFKKNQRTARGRVINSRRIRRTG